MQGHVTRRGLEENERTGFRLQIGLEMGTAAEFIGELRKNNANRTAPEIVPAPQNQSMLKRKFGYYEKGYNGEGRRNCRKIMPAERLLNSLKSYQVVHKSL